MTLGFPLFDAVVVSIFLSLFGTLLCLSAFLFSAGGALVGGGDFSAHLVHHALMLSFQGAELLEQLLFPGCHCGFTVLEGLFGLVDPRQQLSLLVDRLVCRVLERVELLLELLYLSLELLDGRT